MAAGTPQHELNDLLQTELLHTLGSYGVVGERLDALTRRLKSPGAKTAGEMLFPRELVPRIQKYNKALRMELHRPAPISEADAEAYPRHPRPRLDRLVDKQRDQWVADFYASSVAALTAEADEVRDADAHKLGRALKVIHDPRRPGTVRSSDRSEQEQERLARLLDERIARNSHRRDQARVVLKTSEPQQRVDEILYDPSSPELAEKHADGRQPLHVHVVGALVEAHLRMHAAEHLASKAFGQAIKEARRSDAKVRRELQRSLVLNTFVYVVGRTVPWIFAEDADERDYVLRRFEHCSETLTPTYCMWTSHQLWLLALHRRAYTWALLRRPDRAYNDYDKVKRYIRGLEQRVEHRISHAPGARAFMNGLVGLAEHHTGRIYRSEHAHTAALRHFKRAATRLQHLEDDPEMQEALRNSRWRVNLLIGRAKACYELGLVKRSLLYYVYAWRAFLELADTENMAQANFEIVDEVIAWLREVEEDADLNKVELRRRIAPLVEQFQTALSPVHLRVLAADIIMRFGHQLSILKLPSEADGEKADHELAYRCLLHAAWLNQSSTLVATDVRKVRQLPRRGEPRRDAERKDDEESWEELVQNRVAALGVQWPGGSSRFEETARLIEYLLHIWLEESRDERTVRSPGKLIARELLDAFLAHTDSSNVKLAQVYRYLMQDSGHDPDDPLDVTPVKPGEAPSVELISMRRYSSFFPFLPRPSAFRVLGGGYFVRVPWKRSGARRKRSASFGIVVDPGPHFVDNLYRCGYCLDDVHMVIVTHDHADHIAALDPLLALVGYRMKLGDTTFRPDSPDTPGRRLAIVGNESVYERYSFYNEPQPESEQPRRDAVSVFTFRDWADPSGAPHARSLLKSVVRPPGLGLMPVRTVDHPDAHGHLAQGFLLRYDGGEERASILFMSDAGKASLKVSETQARKVDCMALSTALKEASIVVAHVSSVPLRELRELARWKEAPAGERAQQMTDSFRGLWAQMQAQATGGAGRDQWRERRAFLLRQVQYGFHSRPDTDLQPDPDKALLVSPLSSLPEIREAPTRHLYLTGLRDVATRIARDDREKLLLVGELREELGTFRTRIASAINTHIFEKRRLPTRALTADIGLKVRLTGRQVKVQCTTCDLDNDRVVRERLHAPREICEVCVKGEEEGIFYNCRAHDPKRQPEATWVERVERYDPFGP